MYYTARLKAGVPLQVAATGRIIMVDTTGAATGVDITPMRGGQELRKLPKRQQGFKCIVDYDTVVFQAAVDCDIGMFLSMTEVSLGFIDGLAVKVSGEVVVKNDSANPIPVSLQDGVVNVTATNIGVNNDLKTITDFAPVDVGTVAAVLVGDPTQKRLRIRNGNGAAVVAIGGQGVTMERAAIRLMPGDVWIEDDAPGATWYAVSDTAGAKVQIQGLK